MLKVDCFLAIVAIYFSLTQGFVHQPFRQICGDTSSWTKHSTRIGSVKQIYPHYLKTGGAKVSMSMVLEVGESTPNVISDGFQKYEVGQQYEGIVASVKPFGLFVDIAEGAKVLLPRSKMSKGAFERLKAMCVAKSSEAVKVELITINSQNQTLTGQYISTRDPSLPDFQALKTLPKKARQSMALDATVLSTHEFGVFAELNDYGLDGLIPVSMLPDKLSPANMMRTYT